MTIAGEVAGETMKPISNMAKTAPSLVALMLLVMAFLVSQWQADIRDEKMFYQRLEMEKEAFDKRKVLDDLRITQCHDQQAGSAKAMHAMAEALSDQAGHLRDFTRELETHNRQSEWRPRNEK